MEALRDLLCAGARLLGQRRGELELRRQELVGEAELRRRAGQARDEQGLGLVLGKARELGSKAVEQLEAAARSAVGVDWDARGAELLDVAIDRAHRDLEGLGQRLGGQPAAGLQHQQDREQAARAHDATLAGILARFWQLLQIRSSQASTLPLPLTSIAPRSSKTNRSLSFS
jgi:hypothetical protein